MIRVLVVDDQPMVRRGLSWFLADEHGIEVVGEAGSGPEAVLRSRELRPDVVLMDVRMPGGDGLAATRELTGAPDGPAVVVVTTFDLDEYLFGALEAGAAGFMLKDCEPSELVEAVRVAAQGEALVSPRMTRRVIAEFARRRPPVDTGAVAQLTLRERELVAALAEGLNNAELAARLHIEVSTVKSHLGRICTRLGLRDRVQLVVWAHRVGLA
ncbi:response regulator transcription factor [Luteococcus sediminum]|uniref:response regulator n=1 Tax=Luteococcus sp. TaxID=1969402 RepID=UPI003734D744